MRCLHCNTVYLEHPPFARPLAGGRAFAQVCPTCGHVLAIRPRLDTDPPLIPPGFTNSQLARLDFVKWLLHDEAIAQVTPPPTAA
jgi:hypothetical protein